MSLAVSAAVPASTSPGWDGGFQVLVDIEGDAEQTYAALEAELDEHRSLLTRFSNGKVKQGAVTVVVGGNRPRRQFLAARS